MNKTPKWNEEEQRGYYANPPRGVDSIYKPNQQMENQREITILGSEKTIEAIEKAINDVQDLPNKLNQQMNNQDIKPHITDPAEGIIIQNGGTFTKKITLGEFRVRTEFNPSKDNIVDQIKQKSAELINLVNSLTIPEGKESYYEGININVTAEFARLKATAMTSYEKAAMDAVKAATL